MKGDRIREPTGPAHHSDDRQRWEATLLELELQRLRPTRQELTLLRRARKRWGHKRPAPHEVLGDVRPGIYSLLSLSVSTGIEL